MLDARFLAWVTPKPCLAQGGCDAVQWRDLPQPARDGAALVQRLRKWMPDVDSNHD